MRYAPDGLVGTSNKLDSQPLTSRIPLRHRLPVYTHLFIVHVIMELTLQAQPQLGYRAKHRCRYQLPDNPRLLSITVTHIPFNIAIQYVITQHGVNLKVCTLVRIAGMSANLPT
jgi:hypothetical protein